MDINNFKNSCDAIISKGNVVERSTDEAYPLLAKCCDGFIGMVWRKSRALIKHIIFDSEVNRSNPQPYLSILEFICDASRSQSNEEREISLLNGNDFKDWDKIIEIALSTQNTSHYFKSKDDYPDTYNKEIEFSKACSRLSEQGVSFCFEKDNIFISKDSHDLVLQIIDGFIEEIGGMLILDYTFRMLETVYEPTQERFHIYRKTTQGVDYIQPENPWGYLIALGVKNLNRLPKTTGQKNVANFLSFLQFIKDIIATFEIQPYIVWESIYVDDMKTVEFLQENILYDNLISFFQLKSEHALKIISAVNDHWSQVNVESLGFSLKDVIKVGHAIIESSNTKHITQITKSKISKKCGLQSSLTNKVIDSIYVNKNSLELGFPPSSEAIEHLASPLSIFQGIYLALPKPITSLAVLNTILNHISRPDGVFNNAQDSSVGKFIEEFVYTQVKQRGVNCFRGDYITLDKKIKGDCDLLIKADGYIYIFEMKKKALTRKAMSGTDYQIIKDLADSVMRSQSQCAKIEYVLLNDKKLTLTENGRNVTIPYNGERVVKVSLSLHDFGALQDKIILSTILKLSLRVKFSAEDSEASGKLASWKQYVDIFEDYTSKSQGLRKIKDEQFMDYMFMSIPQLLTILDNVSNENDFRDLTKTSQHMTYSTRCFYKEFTLHKKLREHKRP